MSSIEGVVKNMSKSYYQATMEMENKGVDSEYIIGWQGGYLGHPKREEQRQTKAWQAGYQDGLDKKTDGYQDWIQS